MQHVYSSHLHASKPNVQICSSTETLSHHIIRQKHQLYYWLVLMAPAVISICYKKKKRTTIASCKGINDLFFLYNLYENNITYVL